MQFWPPWQWSLLDNSRNSFHMYSLEKVLAYFFIDLHIFDCSFFFYSCDNFSVNIHKFLVIVHICTYASKYFDYWWWHKFHLPLCIYILQFYFFDRCFFFTIFLLIIYFTYLYRFFISIQNISILRSSVYFLQ